LRFTRDATGRITSISKPDGKTLHYNYDGEGNLTEMVDAGGSLSQPAISQSPTPHGEQMTH
jgi:YD repeat-containing protein